MHPSAAVSWIVRVTAFSALLSCIVIYEQMTSGELHLLIHTGSTEAGGPLPGRTGSAHVFAQGVPGRLASITGRVHIAAAGAGDYIHLGLLGQWPVMHGGSAMKWAM